jgi:hypothetical protein
MVKASSAELRHVWSAHVLRSELHDHDPGTRMTLSDGTYAAHGRDGAEAGWTAALESSRHSSPSEHEQRSR